MAEEEQKIESVTDFAVAAAASPPPPIQADNAVISKDQEEKQSGHCATTFQLRTIRPGSFNSQRRIEILPSYPLARSESTRRVLLLLSNKCHVDRHQCEKDSFCGGYGICPFELTQHRYVEPIDSFMIDLYRDVFLEPSRQWKIPFSLIDFNLSRLRTCMNLYTKQTTEPAISSLNELTIALEFFLQIDVDMFFMKTYNFRGAHPRLLGKNGDEAEGILCEAKPTARYGMMPCRERNCFLCQRRVGESREVLNVPVQFASNQIHRFVSKYDAILNCHANCISSNVIYALTCPCGQCDFIGSTSTSFHDRILKHRDESNRIAREFLIGTNNIDHILKQQSRSAETLANNGMFLYQHSPRCSLVLQLFLDNNPEYWCLVPMLWDESRADDDVTANSSMSPEVNARYTAVSAQLPPESPTFAKKPRFFEEVFRNSTRSIEECIWLSKGVPKPPSGYRFSRRQIHEQIDFFKFKKEANILPSNLIDFYKYTIIAVLPDDCSYELRRFIEALFITHAETKLNTIGRLTHSGPWSSSATSFDHSNRGDWCQKLVRR